MTTMYQHLTIETIGHVVHVRLRQARLVEDQLAVMIDELFDLGQNGPSPKVVFCLGPEPPLFLYSIFLARLVTLQRLLASATAPSFCARWLPR